MELVNQEQQSKLPESLLKETLIKNLMLSAVLKGVALDKEQFMGWVDRIQKDYQAGLLKDIQAGFDALAREKTYGGLDYSVFYNGANNNSGLEAYKAYSNLLASFNNSRIKLDARTEKVLKIIGREAVALSSPGDSFVRREFVDIYNKL